MTIRVLVDDGSGAGNQAKVSSRGQLVVGPIDFSQAYNATASVNNTAYNLVGPQTGKQFVITDILLYANKNVGANDATVTLYEATSSTETTVSTTILLVEMLKQTARDITGLNLVVTEGRWINVKTDDNTVYATIMGYYVQAA